MMHGINTEKEKETPRRGHRRVKERPEFVPPSYALFYIILNCGTCKGKYYQLEAMSTCQTVMHSSFVMVLRVILFCFTLALNRKAQEGKHPICILLEIWAKTPTCESLLTPHYKNTLRVVIHFPHSELLPSKILHFAYGSTPDSNRWEHNQCVPMGSQLMRQPFGQHVHSFEIKPGLLGGPLPKLSL